MRQGARIIAVTDAGGGAYRAEGLDPVELRRRFQEMGTIAGAPGTAPLTNDELFALDVDILVLAAMEGQVTARNADTVQARILAEAANGPVTPDADLILRANGVTLIPDILCNAGGVIVSYFEWVQNREAFAWTIDEINERLRRQILGAAAQVYARADQDGIDPRLAAHAIAVGRVAESTSLRGLYP